VKIVVKTNTSRRRGVIVENVDNLFLTLVTGKMFKYSAVLNISQHTSLF